MLRWLNGVFWTLAGWIAVLMLYGITMLFAFVPFALSAVVALGVTDSSLLRLLIISPAVVIWGAFFFWSAVRFFWPCIFGLWAKAGLVFQKSADVTSSRVFDLINDRLHLTWQDARWYFSKVRA